MLPPLRLLIRYVFLVVVVFVIIDSLYLWSNDANLRGGIFQLRRHGGPALDYYVKSSFDWGNSKPFFPVLSMLPLPSGTPNPLPRVQYEFKPESPLDRRELDKYRSEVKRAFRKCWKSYRKYAWMNDELTPLSGRGKDPFGGWRATLVDSLDTLWIMGLEKEFHEAVEAVAGIDFAKTDSTSANMFETTIRYLGGLLSAYDLSNEKVLLLKATEIGDLLYAGFDTPNHLPAFWLDFEKAKHGKLSADSSIPLASPCTLSLEFTRLSQLTGNNKYYDAINRIGLLMEKAQNSTSIPGLWPVYLNLATKNLVQNNYFSLGGDSDSAYEYIPKMHHLLAGLDTKYTTMAQITLEAIKNNMLFRPMLPEGDDILFPGDIRVSSARYQINPEVQHLGCFTGGMFAISGRLFNRTEYVEVGAKLTKGCIWAYNAFPTGIMPEALSMIPCANPETCPWDDYKWKVDGGVNVPRGVKIIREKQYILRPEAIESVFILYRITGQAEYQDAAWKMFKAIMAATETKYGNAGIDDVNVTGETSKRDSMESFWLAETLKYFYLIFSPPDLISLDDYVLNTEAHPLKRQT